MDYGARNGDRFGRGGRGLRRDGGDFGGGRGGGRGGFFKPSSPDGFSRAHDKSYTARYDNASGVSLAAEDVVDRQRDRKDRRRRERQQKKQSRIHMHEQLTEERRYARQQAQERKAVAQAEAQRKRQRAERTASKTERSAKKRQREEAEEEVAVKATVAKRKSEAAAAAAAPSDPKAKTASAKKKRSVPMSVEVEPTSPLHLSSSSALPATPAVPADTTVVPVAVTEKVRRLVNKLTMSNVVDLTNDLSEFMATGGVSRAAVMKGLAQQLERLCRLETGPMNTTGTLPFAGLVRGTQLLHGNQVGAELVERVSFSLQGQLAAGEEAAAGNTLMVLAQLYLLYGVDVVFVVSLLRMLLRQGRRILDVKDDAAAAAAVATQAVCAASCGLALMRACGEKLLKESPSELEAALQEARAASAQMRSVTGTARFSALVEVMGDIASGRTRASRRTATETAAPVDAMLEDLCSLLPGQEKASATQRRTMKRLVLSTNLLTGLTWDQVTAVEKPPRWYVPGIMATAADSAAAGRSQLAKKAGNARHAEEEEEGAGGDEDRLGRGRASSDKDREESSEEEEELDEYELKRERIARMRTEERAISGQRLNTEHKREIFKCIASATDDLECFTMLMYRDPGYIRFHDVCSVLLQCVCQEKTYNPYYVQVLMRFCSAKPACLKTLQFAVWDRFKAVRIETTDIVGYFNLSCCIADLIQNGVYNLGILRGLDLENTNKTIGLFTRVLLLRLILQLPAARLTQLFFGGDGLSAHDLQVDTGSLRRLLVKFMGLYFVDESATKRWLPNFYDVVAAGTDFDVSQLGLSSASLLDGSASAEVEARLLQRNADRPTSSLSATAATPSTSRAAAAAARLSTSPEALLAQFMKRVQVVYKALKQGIS